MLRLPSSCVDNAATPSLSAANLSHRNPPSVRPNQIAVIASVETHQSPDTAYRHRRRRARGPEPYLAATNPMLPTDNVLLSTSGVTRRSTEGGRTLLLPTDFNLCEGDRIVIAGPAGSGKSVFMRTLALLDRIDGGVVAWRHAPVARHDIPAFRRRVSYIAQRPAMIDGSVEDNLRYPFSLKVYRDLAFRREVAIELLSAAGRGADFLGKSAADLSGGEAQITALIRVLQLAPEVLLLDEPTASLDPASTRDIEALIDEWLQRNDTRAAIWVSHNDEQARRVGRRHLLMNAGVLQESFEASLR
jgi:putative ABC transport system ATP-binding protein